MEQINVEELLDNGLSINNVKNIQGEQNSDGLFSCIWHEKLSSWLYKKKTRDGKDTLLSKLCERHKNKGFKWKTPCMVHIWLRRNENYQNKKHKDNEAHQDAQPLESCSQPIWPTVQIKE